MLNRIKTRRPPLSWAMLEPWTKPSCKEFWPLLSSWPLRVERLNISISIYILYMQWYDTDRSTLQFPGADIKEEEAKGKKAQSGPCMMLFIHCAGVKARRARAQARHAKLVCMESILLLQAGSKTLNPRSERPRQRKRRTRGKELVNENWLGQQLPMVWRTKLQGRQLCVWEEQGAKNRSTDKDCKQERAPMSKALQTGWV